MDSHPLVDHLAEVHGLVRELRPAPAQHDLKDGAHQSSSALEWTHTVGLEMSQQR